MRTRLRPLLASLVALASAAAVVPTTTATAAVPARRIVVTGWDSDAELALGRAHGVEVVDGRLRLGRPVGRTGNWDYGRWRSPWVKPGYDLTELVASWEAKTPGRSWVKVEVRGRTGDRRTSSWDTLAHWALKDRHFTRTSLDSQPDDLGRVAYDTWITGGVASWQLRVTLLRRTGTTARPKVDAISAMASALPSVSGVTTSKPSDLVGTVLDVPAYSQMAHKGTYPEYDGGGEAWCSPTSTTMVLGYYDALPGPKAYAWVQDGYTDPEVAHLARMTYDDGFGGTGNWPFNTAYAASRTGSAFVTRLRNLREAERFIAAGIPLIASVTFSSGELSGAPIRSTNGHLMVIVGFTKSGDVVVNDPAAADRSGVRRTYDRDQFEDVWLRRGTSAGGSGGLVYVIHDEAHPLPERNGNRNW